MADAWIFSAFGFSALIIKVSWLCASVFMDVEKTDCELIVKPNNSSAVTNLILLLISYSLYLLAKSIPALCQRHKPKLIKELRKVKQLSLLQYGVPRRAL